MPHKLLAFFALVAAVSALDAFCGSRRPESTISTSGIALLPPAIGEQTLASRWNNDKGGGVIEEGALYGSGGQSSPVQLDFYRGSHEWHNAVICYVTVGEFLVRDGVRSLKTVDGAHDFDIALTRSENTLRAVASTECSAVQCSEQLTTGLHVHTDFEAPDRSVVPVSVVLTRPLNKASEDQDSDELMRQLVQAISEINLAPAQALAAATP